MNTDSERKSRDLVTILNDRMKEQGWVSIEAFVRESGIEASVESVRRAFTEKGVYASPDTTILVMTYLDYSLDEIRRLVENYFEGVQKEGRLWYRLLYPSRLKLKKTT